MVVRDSRDTGYSVSEVGDGVRINEQGIGLVMVPDKECRTVQKEVVKSVRGV